MPPMNPVVIVGDVLIQPGTRMYRTYPLVGIFDCKLLTVSPLRPFLFRGFDTKIFQVVSSGLLREQTLLLPFSLSLVYHIEDF